MFGLLLASVATAVWAEALASCTVTSRLGCFVDTETGQRVLPNGMKAPSRPASLSVCASLVAEQVGSGTTLDLILGVEAGKQCWWGPRNHAAGHKTVPASECNLPCAGNHSETCGGDWRLGLCRSF